MSIYDLLRHFLHFHKSLALSPAHLNFQEECIFNCTKQLFRLNVMPVGLSAYGNKN